MNKEQFINLTCEADNKRDLLMFASAQAMLEKGFRAQNTLFAQMPKEAFALPAGDKHYEASDIMNSNARTPFEEALFLALTQLYFLGNWMEIRCGYTGVGIGSVELLHRALAVLDRLPLPYSEKFKCTPLFGTMVGYGLYLTLERDEALRYAGRLKQIFPDLVFAPIAENDWEEIKNIRDYPSFLASRARDLYHSANCFGKEPLEKNKLRARAMSVADVLLCHMEKEELQHWDSDFWIQTVMVLILSSVQSLEYYQSLMLDAEAQNPMLWPLIEPVVNHALRYAERNPYRSLRGKKPDHTGTKAYYEKLERFPGLKLSPGFRRLRAALA